MKFDNILYEIENGILYLTLNRPDVRNALGPEMWMDIRTAVQCAREDDAVKVIIISGAGDIALASGADIKEIHDREYLKMLLGTSSVALKDLEDLYKPVICAINGYALGGGCELAMACDLRIATKRSKFGQPEVNLSIIPGAGGTQRLTRLVGIGRAKELIYTGRIIDADEACTIGLINRVTDNNRADLMAEAEKMAKQIMSKGPVAITVGKIAINLGSETDINTALMIERLAQTIAFSTKDREEGTAAFLEKRTPTYQGR